MADHDTIDHTGLTGVSGNVAADTLWDAAGDLVVGTGANTAARLAKGADGGMLAMGNGAVIWNAGTSFPASKLTNDRYWRTDLGMGFHWDGSRWVSDQLFNYDITGGQEIVLPLSATGGTTRMGTSWGVGTDVWLENAITTFFVSGGTALGASHKWVGIIRKVDTANSFTTLITVNIDSGASDTQRIDTQAIGALLGTAAAFPALSPTWTKTGTPGTLRPTVRVTCRIVQT